MKKIGLINCLIFLSIIGNAQLNRSLILHYTFDNSNANDISGNGNNGMSSNVTFPFESSGNLNRVAMFQGNINSVITMPDSLISKHAFITISMWIRTTSQGVLIAQQENALPTISTGIVPVFYLRNDSSLNAKLWDGFSSRNINNSRNNLCDSNWHHVVITADSRNQDLYIDNVKTSPVSPGHTRLSNLIKNQLGTGQTNGWPSAPNGIFSYKGLIDEVRIYSRRLQVFEIDSLYREKAKILSLKTTNESETKIKIYPNPTSGILNIVSELEDLNSIEVMNVKGAIVVTKFNNFNVFDASNLPQGSYILIFKNHKGKIIQRKRFIKSN